MGRAMNRIDLNGRRNVETGLLETERQTARAGEQVDADRSGKRQDASSSRVVPVMVFMSQRPRLSWTRVQTSAHNSANCKSIS